MSRAVRAAAVLLAIVAAAASARSQERAPEATSLLGRPLHPAAPSADALPTLERELADAKAAYDKSPNDADAIIWLGRRTAYLGRYREAIDIYTRGIGLHPSDARLYRHRGHRHITVRELDRAVADLTTAAALVAKRPDEIEPDGQPNARNIPTSTLNSNVFYHLGLAHYLKGDFEPALRAYRDCLRFSKNPDMLAATSHWLYMTLRRLKRAEEAAKALHAIEPGMDIIENASYHKLLLMYKGVEPADALLDSVRAGGGIDAVTIAYGVANWHLYNGRREEAMTLFQRIVDGHAGQWPAFGYLAAEAELARVER